MDDETRNVRAAWCCALVCLTAACGEVAGEPEPDYPVMSERCVAPPRPRSNAKVRLQRVFANVAVEGAVAMTHRRGDDSRWYVARKDGVVLSFRNEENAQATVFLDLSDAVQVEGEAGLLDIAFHPDFDENGEVYVSYTAPGGTAFLSRFSRFTSPDGGVTADRSTEEVVLEVDQPYVNHNGGDIGFGPDGFLYIGLGDGGSAGDPPGNGQNVDTLLGSMLRIDVDTPTDGRAYGIPADNPFAAGGGAPEVFAWGLRNPWRWNFDSRSGELWAGDVGQHVWEEIDVIRNGGNYGWKVREGTDCLNADTCATDGLVEPVAQYRNTGSASVVAGFVYHGTEIEGLQDTFIYNDFYFGTLFGVPAAGGKSELIGDDARGIAGWAEGEDGELYGVDYNDGGIFKLVAAPSEEGPGGFPILLSYTGCVDPDNPGGPGEGAFTYEVNHPFWSDGADKTRAIAIPDGAEASVLEGGDLDLPDGTVLVKSFFRDGLPIETRLLVRHDDGGWAGYGYAWNAEGTDAEYVEETRTQDVGGAPWVFPASRECLACHNASSGRSLGLEVGQLRRTVVDEVGLEVEQLAAWVQRGWLSAEPGGDGLPADDAASLDARARAYLHVNCAICHREEGNGGRSSLDLRFDTPLADTKLCDANPRAGALGLQDARIVAPGAPERSVLVARMLAENSARMPPLSSALPDQDAVALLEAWITAMPGCP